MADSVTTNYNWIQPEVTASFDTWGNKLNNDLEAIDAKVFSLDIHLAEEGTLADVDHVGFVDADAPQAVKKITWAGVKAFLKTYFDTLYAAINHTHAVVTNEANGFMSSAQKTKLDGIQTGATANSTDTFLRDLANSTGTLPGTRFTDSSHGNRGGGALHSVATSGAAGFMSAEDKAKLDGIQAGATANSSDSFLRNLANSTGTLPAARFNDSSHGNRGGGSLHALATTSQHGFMSASDKAKLNVAWTDNDPPSAGQIGSRYSGLGNGSIGTYVMARWMGSSNVDWGTTTSGSNLRRASADGDITGSGLGGTWRCMGFASNDGAVSSTTLWMRIA